MPSIASRAGLAVHRFEFEHVAIEFRAFFSVGRADGEFVDVAVLGAVRKRSAACSAELRSAESVVMLSVDLPAFESGAPNNVLVQLTTPRRSAPQVGTRLRYVAH